jgi:hypothetical protein
MGSSAAAAIIIKEKHIAAAFRRAGATTASAAVSPDALGVHQRAAFKRLERRAVLRQAALGQFYLDEPTWEALRRTRRRLALVLALLGLLLAALAIVQHSIW